LDRLGRFLGALGPMAAGGHSLGAWLLRELMRQRAICPAAAVLVSPPGPLRGRDARRTVAAAGGGDETSLRAALREEAAAGRPLPPLVEAAIEASCVQDPARWRRLVEELLPLLRSGVPAFDPRCPTLVLGGAADPIAPAGAMQAVAAATRGAR